MADRRGSESELGLAGRPEHYQIRPRATLTCLRRATDRGTRTHLAQRTRWRPMVEDPQFEIVSLYGRIRKSAAWNMVIFPDDGISPETSEEAPLCANFLPSRAACRPRYRFLLALWCSFDQIVVRIIDQCAAGESAGPKGILRIHQKCVRGRDIFNQNRFHFKYWCIDRVPKDSNETQSFFDMDRAHIRWDLRNVIRVSCARLIS